MNKGFTVVAVFLSVLAFTSCKSKQVVPSSDSDLFAKIDYLKTRCKGDNDLLANILDVRNSALDSLIAGQTEVSESFENRVEEVFAFASAGGVSLTKIRSKYDTGLRWYDKILYWPVTHPGWFWGITAFLLVFFILNRMDSATNAVVTSPYTLSGIGGFLARLFFFIKNGFVLEVLLYIVVVILHFVL